MMHRPVLRRALAGLAIGAFVAVIATPAWGQDTSVSTDIRANSEGNLVGSAQLQRSAASDGTETLNLHMSIPGGIGESHVCLAAAPFASRVPPGSCPYSQGATGTTADYQIPLGASYASRTLYVQAHAVTLGDTAYAGWQSGSPFFGNVAVPAASAPTEVPAGTFGGLVLALLLGAALLMLRKQRAGATR
jgi:hypothetical protein